MVLKCTPNESPKEVSGVVGCRGTGWVGGRESGEWKGLLNVDGLVDLAAIDSFLAFHEKPDFCYLGRSI